MEKQDETSEGISCALTVSIPDGPNKQGVTQGQAISQVAIRSRTGSSAINRIELLHHGQKKATHCGGHNSLRPACSDGCAYDFCKVTGRGQAIYLSPRQGPPTMDDGTPCAQYGLSLSSILSLSCCFWRVVFVPEGIAVEYALGGGFIEHDGGIVL